MKQVIKILSACFFILTLSNIGIAYSVNYLNEKEILQNGNFTIHYDNNSNPSRDIFPGWKMGAIKETPNPINSSLIYPYFWWSEKQKFRNPHEGLLIDAPTPSIAYFQQDFFYQKQKMLLYNLLLDEM